MRLYFLYMHEYTPLTHWLVFNFPSRYRTPCQTSREKRPTTTIDRTSRRRHRQPHRRPPDRWAENTSASPAIRYRRPPRTTVGRPPCCDTIASRTCDAKRSRYRPGAKHIEVTHTHTSQHIERNLFFCTRTTSMDVSC